MIAEWLRTDTREHGALSELFNKIKIKHNADSGGRGDPASTGL